MRTVAILGAGNGGVSAAVDLSLRGFKVILWNRSAATLKPLQQLGGIKHTGVLGEGFLPLKDITDDLSTIAGADVLLICLPTLALASVAKQLSALSLKLPPIILNPGHTGGALEFVAVLQQSAKDIPPIAEFSTLTYVARKLTVDSVHVSGVARHVWVAAFPGGETAVELSCELYPCAKVTRDVLGTGLANVNMVLHPPGAILGASWSESTKGDFTFYVEGLTPGVSRVMDQLDKERLRVASAYDHTLPNLFSEMQMIGTIEETSDPALGLAHAIRSGRANRHIKGPDSLQHRYYLEDFWYGLMPFLVFAEIAQVEVPMARSLMNVAEVLLSHSDQSLGRTAASMGIAGCTREGLLDLIKVSN